MAHQDNHLPLVPQAVQVQTDLQVQLVIAVNQVLLVPLDQAVVQALLVYPNLQDQAEQADLLAQTVHPVQAG